MAIDRSMPERAEIRIDTKLRRDNPSPRYLELVKEYGNMHLTADGMFNGRSLVKFVDIIDNFLKRRKCKTLLDYGCGKGYLYTDDFLKVTDQINKPVSAIWGLENYTLFDPGYEEHSKRPEGKFDAVISTDVIEHIPESDVMWVIDEILNYSSNMVFINIACFKALKTLANGDNAHISVFHYYDWLELLSARIIHFKDISVYAFFDIFTKEGTMDLKGFKLTAKEGEVRIIELIKE
jgi:SAM-dependent methyltransferase